MNLTVTGFNFSRDSHVMETEESCHKGGEPYNRLMSFRCQGKLGKRKTKKLDAIIKHELVAIKRDLPISRNKEKGREILSWLSPIQENSTSQ